MKNAILLTLREGGITLGALLVLAVMIYSLIYGVWQHGKQARAKVAAGEWNKRGQVGGAMPWERGNRDNREIERSFATFELDEMAWIERRLPFLGVLIAAAPLLGLLGTVAGMLVTFGGMASGAGSAPIDVISGGISKALVTTQAGLVVAVPAAFIFALLKRQTESTHLELQRQLHEELKGGVA
ncbi:MotA/TolQ/ExbB proton channel family protein [Haloferula chungangensis]|uniref:MotA/TolQ/ExbB proton channel family protein n=1 Tax=Haloferula chungangensis TaxID=1048331 RepID=A0ABW2L7J6_9BACT